MSKRCDRFWPVHLTVVLFLTVLPRASGATSEMPDEIRNALQANAESLSPLRLQVVQTTSAPSLTREAFANGPTTGSTTSLEWRWQNGMIYARQTAKGAAEQCYDGQTYYLGGVDRTRYSRTPIQSMDADRVLFSFMYLQDAGFIAPTTVAAVRKGRCVSRLLDAIDEQGGRLVSIEHASIQSVPIVRITLECRNDVREAAIHQDILTIKEAMLKWGLPMDRANHFADCMRRTRESPPTLLISYSLDPQLNYAVRQITEAFPDGTLLGSGVNSDFAQVGNRKLWLPRTAVWSAKYFAACIDLSADELTRRSFNVTVMDGSLIPARQFVLDYDVPGTTIVDNSISGPGNSTFVPAPPVFTNPSRSDSPPTSDLSPFALLTLASLAAVSVMAAALGWLVYHRKSRSK